MFVPLFPLCCISLQASQDSSPSCSKPPLILFGYDPALCLRTCPAPLPPHSPSPSAPCALGWTFPSYPDSQFPRLCSDLCSYVWICLSLSFFFLQAKCPVPISPMALLFCFWMLAHGLRRGYLAAAVLRGHVQPGLYIPALISASCILLLVSSRARVPGSLVGQRQPSEAGGDVLLLASPCSHRCTEDARCPCQLSLRVSGMPLYREPLGQHLCPSRSVLPPRFHLALRLAQGILSSLLPRVFPDTTPAAKLP